MPHHEAAARLVSATRPCGCVPPKAMDPRVPTGWTLATPLVSRLELEDENAFSHTALVSRLMGWAWVI